MSYRPIRRPEFNEALCDRQQLKTWRHYVWFAHALYGPHAWRIVVDAAWREVPSAGGRSEPCLEAYMTAFTVYDQRGQILEPDLRQPHWQEWLQQRDLTAHTSEARAAARAQAWHAATTQFCMTTAGTQVYRVDTQPVPRMPPFYVGGESQTYRPVCDAELEMMLQDLCTHNEWEFFSHFARDVYGPRAAQIDIIGTWGELDTTWPAWDTRKFVEMRSIVVSDSTGVPLAPDLTTAWWQDWLQAPDTLAMAEEVRAAAIAQRLDSYAREWPSLTAEHEPFSVDTPPARRGPILFIREPN